MTDTKLLKNEFPMKLSGTTPRTAHFRRDREDHAGRAHWHEMDRRLWDDLGRPDVITVTVEPGNRLNEEEA